MKRVPDFFRKGNIIPLTLVGSAILGFMAVISFLVLPLDQSPLADMRLQPTQKILGKGDTFTVDVLIRSSVPVNVFAGELLFNNKILEVQSIDYNTSIADLWAKKPWYSNGEGTLNFIGGTTRQGGFIGTDKLLSITFKALGEGDGTLTIHDAQILQDDGLGTLVELAKPIDALFTVQGDQTISNAPGNLVHSIASGSSYKVVETAPSSDLNNDGTINIADASIMLLHLGSTDKRYDLNLDGTVDLSDLQVIIASR